MEFISWLFQSFTARDYISSLALAMTIFGFILAFNQYRKMQKWKRSEFAAEHLSKLREDDALALSVMLLDWENREFAVPESYQHLTEENSFVHNRVALGRALLPMNEAPDESHPCGYSWVDCIYRDTFDALFSYLELTEHFISNKLITAQDVKPIAYILKQVKGQNECEYTGFIPYIEQYDFTGATKLIKKFEDEKLF
ncbi:hypothetical protein [Photobacterium sanguinicancri]|uniref:DUF4760 domain-containing protein n=1 Tax=Photobacterium sanguinicancri TaxID=875932 RepID=A0AAW7YBT9_9GAMM|nr:hypothetical protein [Photobacterium sanguinicancri]MDO6545480.1 hypothetical protein [Photobacterium sanguinicancri]OZS41636.1 hypothetical protein ASV53_22670 [Photobacterium sanguinicancri]